jgi:glutamate-1-semialdehyde aminotransferase
MQLKLSVKQLGKKRPFIDAKIIEIEGEYHQTYSLKDILTQIIAQQVAEFNEKRAEKSLFTFFKETQIQEEAQVGRVKFGEMYNDTQADLQKAIETVLWAFEDGLIAVFRNDEQMNELQQAIIVDENTLFTFVRLTFLAGSIW